MNQSLRRQYKSKWCSFSWFLEYLRGKDIFTNGFTGRGNANPYAYGSVLEFTLFETEIQELIKNKSIKISRLKSIFESCETDLNSPIVVLTGK